MDWSAKSLRRIMLLIAFAILLFLGLQNLSLVLAFLGNVLTLFAPFLVGLCIAFVLNVPMRFLENKILTRKHPKHPPKKFWLAMKRPLSLVLTLLFVAGILFVILFLIIPELSRTFQKMAEDVPLFLQQVQQWMERKMGESSQFGQWLSQLEVDWNTIGQQLMAMLEGGAGGLINLTVNAITSMVGAIVTFVLGFVFALYVLLQKEKLAAQSKRAMAAYLPDPAVNKILSIGELSDKTFSSFLSGQCLESVILGVLFFVSMSLFQFPYAMMISVLIGFASLVPLFGAWIGCIVGAFFILLVSPVQALWFVVLFLVLQQVEGNFIYPYVVGNSVGLPSIWVLVAVTIGGAVLGIFGMLLFIPLSSVAYSLFRDATRKRLNRKRLKQKEHSEMKM